MSQSDIIMIVAGIAGLILSGIDLARTNGQSLTSWAAAVLSVAFVVLALT